MWYIAYQIAIGIVGFSLSVASRFHRKARIRYLAEKKIFDHWHLLLADRPANKNLVWLHCASLGEFDMMIPVMERLKRQQNVLIAVSFFSPSGYEIRKHHPLPDFVGYMPLDFKSKSKKFIEILQPDIAVFVKYEFWYNTFSTLKDKNISLIVTGVRFSKNSAYFGFLKPLYSRLFSKVALFLTQDPYSAEILKRHGHQNSLCVGDTRIDRCLDAKSISKSFSALSHLIKGRKVWILGSTWPEDEKRCIPVINSLSRDIFIILAPHEVSSHRINSLISQLNSRPLLMSDFKCNLNISGEYDWLLVDTIGDLAHLYAYAHVAYIGGAFGRGLHNILEALVHDIPVIFGPDIAKFPEAMEAIDQGFGLKIQDKETLSQAVKYLLDNAKVKAKIQHYIQSNAGAGQRVYEEIINFLPQNTIE